MSAEQQTAPMIVCPDWCRQTREEHLEELKEWAGGDVHHKSAPDAWAYLAQVLRADGVAEPDDQEARVLVCGADIAVSDLTHVIRDLAGVLTAAESLRGRP